MLQMSCASCFIRNIWKVFCLVTCDPESDVSDVLVGEEPHPTSGAPHGLNHPMKNISLTEKTWDPDSVERVRSSSGGSRCSPHHLLMSGLLGLIRGWWAKEQVITSDMVNCVKLTDVHIYTWCCSSLSLVCCHAGAEVFPYIGKHAGCLAWCQSLTVCNLYSELQSF